MRLGLFLLLALLLPGVCRAGEPVRDGQWQRIRSAALNEDREYQVRLPESYRWAKDRRYPVLYLLDGDVHVDHTAASVAFLARWGELPETIVVAVRSTVRVRDFTQSDWPQAWVGGGGAANFKRFLSKELIPKIERSYRADGFRTLYGHSAAGQFALYCLTTEPSLFRAYFALSPSLDWDDNLPQRSLEKSFEATPRLAAFLYVARSDDAGRALADYERLVRTLETKSPEGLRWKSRAFPDERHTTVPLLAEIDALRQLYDGYRFHDDLAAKGFPFAEQHFQELSKRLGWPMAVPEAVVNDFGYAALSAGRTADAIELFRRNTRANPNSANAWDSLADGYAEAGNRKAALEASRRAAALATEYDLPIRSRLVEQVRKRELALAGELPKKD
ncbi:MAG: hypothetical protein JXB05_32610 [Myxococcaceae bacterium]|nr:hypothetical protein [Myxococcaceae bacterium]